MFSCQSFAEEELYLPPKVKEGGVALFPKLLVLLALHASHPLHHLFTQLHGWGQRFGVSAQDVAEVDVKELPWTTTGENTVREELLKQKPAAPLRACSPHRSLLGAGCPGVCLPLPGCR